MSLKLSLTDQLSRCQQRDRYRLRRRLQRLGDDAAELEGIGQAIERSVARRERLQAAVPPLEFPAALPITTHAEALTAQIGAHQVLIVCGETGSGKTTQLPKICLAAGRGVDGLIGHTQPRRLAARAVANRVADELGSNVGELVGIQTRFHQRLGETNLIKLMTDGILLAEIQRDPYLNQYDTLIIDEAHERSLNIDFLLGYLKRLLPKRPDLKLIITSATLDIARIAAHFDDAPVLEIAGRGFPVEMRYRPRERATDDDEELDSASAVDQAIDELQAVAPGDVLVFLPGEREIREVSKRLRHRRERFDVLPLYARLPASEQEKIFGRSMRLRIVLATNVAETSLTVPGIRYVIDLGTARISRYSWRAQIQRLPIEKISKASAAQRAGRCGRTMPGICVRLYSEEDHESRADFTEPEIQRTNLAAVILQMELLKLGSVRQFPFIDAPDPRLIRDGYRLLRELQAIDEAGRLTELGRRLARLPIDPRLARMLLAANEEGALTEVLVIVTALAVGDPRDRPHEKQQAADKAHARYKDKRSDFTSLLSLWRYLDEQSATLSSAGFKKLCRTEYVNFRRWREWRDLYRQVAASLKSLNLSLQTTSSDYDAIHRALLSGLLDHLGRLDERGEFIGSRNRRFRIFPGSHLKSRPPKWLMAAEITETSRVYARTVAYIDTRWIEQLGDHLITRHHTEPHWQKRKARAAIYQRLSINGLTIVEKRRVDLRPVDEALARELFIRHALVYGEWNTKLASIKRNRELVASIEDLEAKTRRRDLLVDESVLYEFYEARIPSHVTSGAALERWLKKDKDADELLLNESDILQRSLDETEVDAFPNRWRQGPLELPLSYSFEPGREEDGVSLHIPLSIAGQIDPLRCEWLVPGLLEEKIQALIRSLPKRIRKHFVPVPDFARACIEALAPYEGSLTAALAEVLSRMSGIELVPEDWQAPLAPHLRMRFLIVDEAGKAIAEGRELARLRLQVAEAIAEQTPAPSVLAFERNGITAWEFDELPDRLLCEEAGYRIERFPALIDDGGSVSLRLLENSEEANQASDAAIRRLLFIALKSERRYLEKQLPSLQRISLVLSPVCPAPRLREDLFLAALMRCQTDRELPRNRVAYNELMKSAREQFVSASHEIAEGLLAVAEAYSEIRKALDRELPLSWIEAVRDIEAQIACLIYPGFIQRTPLRNFARLPRYLHAILARMRKIDGAPDKDRLRRASIEPLVARLFPLDEAGITYSPHLDQYRWLLEEYRVSLFAQELGVEEKVSQQRLDKLWASLERGA